MQEEGTVTSQTIRTRELLPNLETLIGAGTIGRIEGREVGEPSVAPFSSSDSLSGSRFLSVESTSGRRYVVKRIAAEWDWIMRQSNDTLCRQSVAWESGVMDSLPSSITSAVVAASRDGNGWALLLDDHGEDLIP